MQFNDFVSPELKNVMAKSLVEVLVLIFRHIPTKALKEPNLNNHGHRPWKE
jgi:hypothetical protein